MTSPARVVLLGWGNATRSQLVVYERLHKLLGLDPTVLIPNTLEGLGRSNAYARTVAPLAADLAAEGGARPIVVHFFSDNGFMGWAALLAELDATEGGRRAIAAMRGVIVDSAPGLWAVRGPVDFARRFALGMTPAVSRMARLGARERLPVVTPLLGLGFLGYQLLFPRVVSSMLSAWKTVAAKQPRCPHLFLYGEGDVLVPPRDVRAWIERQRDAGIDTEDHAFPEARHVALFPKDARRYRNVVSEFVKRVEAKSSREA
jgi:pimeloyl-ACP methyl ester carboxylesterase